MLSAHSLVYLLKMNTQSHITSLSKYDASKCCYRFIAIKSSAVSARIHFRVLTRAFQFGQKVSIRFSLPNRFFRFDSIRQSDKFAASTLIFK